jgi:hypothetical protein
MKVRVIPRDLVAQQLAIQVHLRAQRLAEELRELLDIEKPASEADSHD